MLYRLRRHPLPIVARFRHSLVLCYALPPEQLEPQLAPGLELDTYRNHAFAAVALVQTERLRPAFLPVRLGVDFFLAGYRIFVRVAGRPSLRGLQILRSDTDRRLMVLAGNLFTHYRYRLVDAHVDERPGRVEIESDGIHVIADLDSRPAPLPPGSPFADEREARRYAGPLPYTFDYERQTGRLVSVRATRGRWDPQPVAVDVLENRAFPDGVLANAFYVGGVGYRWERGELMG
jgi:Uncharacterized conserved protein (COG2071)